MKIAIIVRRLNVRGGTQKLSAQLGRKLRDRGHQVTFYTFSYDKELCYPEFFLDFKVVEPDQKIIQRLKETGGLRGPIGFFRNYFNENQAAKNLAMKIPKDTDILNPHDQLVYRVSRYFKRLVKNIPSVWTINDVSTKTVSLIRATQFDNNARVSILRRLWYWVFDKFEYVRFEKFEDAIVVLDERNKILSKQAFPRVKTLVVRGGLDADEFSYIPRQPIKGKKIHILMFAVLLAHRRFEDGIIACSILRDEGVNVNLTIAGEPKDTKYYEMLKRLVEQHRLENQVNFKLKVTHKDLHTGYREADILLFPCHMQTWGLSVFEAMATGLPVVVSSTAGASEVLKNKETGMIVPACNPQMIAEAIKDLIENQELYLKLSKDGRRFVEQNISWDLYSNEMLRIFKSFGK